MFGGLDRAVRGARYVSRARRAILDNRDTLYAFTTVK